MKPPLRLLGSKRGLWLLCLLVFAGLAQAHKASDSYLQIDAGEPTGIAVRWDIACAISMPRSISTPTRMAS